jgi:hypothetical protein
MPVLLLLIVLGWVLVTCTNFSRSLAELPALPLLRLLLHAAVQVDVLQQELKRLQQQLARQQRAADAALAATKAEALSNRESLAGECMRSIFILG